MWSKIAYATGGAIAASILMLIAALVHYWVLARPLFSFHFRTCHNAGTDRSFDMRHLGRPELRGPETSTTLKTISGFSCFVENIE
jgi:hypothetical protein